MKILRKICPVLCLFALLTACTPAQPQEPPEFSAAGSWELVTADYDPVAYDICQSISFPKYQDKTREEWEDYSIEIGMVDNAFIRWAEGGMLSPDKRYLAYHTTKDNVETGRTSVFLLDMLTGTEQTLLSGQDGGWYSIISWLDKETLLCIRHNFDAPPSYDSTIPTEYWLCGPGRDAVKLPLDGVEHFGWNGRFLICRSKEDWSTLYLLRIGEDDTVTELGQLTVQDVPFNGCAIRPDGTLVAFPLRENMEDPERRVCIWDVQSGQTALLEDPVPASGTEPAAITCWWDEDGLWVNYNVLNQDNDNSHNELWKYNFDTAK